MFRHCYLVILSLCLAFTWGCRQEMPHSEHENSASKPDLKASTASNNDSSATAQKTPPAQSDHLKIVESVLENTLPSFMTEKDVVPVDQLVLLGDATPEEQENVKRLFEQFKTAVLEYKPDAVQYLSDDSIEYYKYMLELARVAVFSPEHYARIQAKLPYGLKTNIELIKQRLSPDFIKSATPQQLYRTAFEQGWIGYRSFQTAAVNNIKAYNRDGKRYLAGDFNYDHSQHDQFILRLGFVPDEKGGFKVDLTPLFIGIEQSIEKLIQTGQMDPDAAMLDTVEKTQQNMTPSQWPVYENQEFGFSIRFPKPPTSVKDGNTAIFSATDHRFGQFSVSIHQCDHTCPTGDEALEKRFIAQSIRALDGKDLDCRQSRVGQNHVVYCKFSIPQHHATMLKATLFLKDRIYQVFNQAPDDRFDVDVAQSFLDTFSY